MISEASWSFGYLQILILRKFIFDDFWHVHMSNFVSSCTRCITIPRSSPFACAFLSCSSIWFHDRFRDCQLFEICHFFKKLQLAHRGRRITLKLTGNKLYESLQICISTLGPPRKMIPEASRSFGYLQILILRKFIFDDFWHVHM